MLDRAGFVSRANGNLFSRKLGGPVAVARRAGQNFTYAQLMYWYMLADMIVPGSTYWNVGFGLAPGDIESDTEAFETIERFAENLAWLAKKNAGLAAMTFDEVVRARHSVRAYADRPVPAEDIRAICEAARLAPSASNTQTWRFIAVTDRELLDRLCKEGMRKVVSNKWSRQAPLIIVGCSKRDIMANPLGRHMMDSEYYQIDMGIAMEHLVLKATDLGLATCWIGWFNEEGVKRVLGIPDKVRVHVMATVGYAKEGTVVPALHKRKPLDKILFYNGWSERAAAQEE